MIAKCNCGNTVEVKWGGRVALSSMGVYSRTVGGIMCRGNECAYGVSLTIDANYPDGKLAEQLVIEMWNRVQENIK